MGVWHQYCLPLCAGPVPENAKGREGEVSQQRGPVSHSCSLLGTIMFPDSDFVPLQVKAESNCQHRRVAERATEKPKGRDLVLSGATSLQLCVSGSNSHCLILGVQPWENAFVLPPHLPPLPPPLLPKAKSSQWRQMSVTPRNLAESRKGFGGGS